MRCDEVRETRHKHLIDDVIPTWTKGRTDRGLQKKIKGDEETLRLASERGRQAHAEKTKHNSPITEAMGFRTQGD